MEPKDRKVYRVDRHEGVWLYEREQLQRGGVVAGREEGSTHGIQRTGPWAVWKQKPHDYGRYRCGCCHHTAVQQGSLPGAPGSVKRSGGR